MAALFKKIVVHKGSVVRKVGVNGMYGSQVSNCVRYFVERCRYARDVCASALVGGNIHYIMYT
jgi:hypothetical protein